MISASEAGVISKKSLPCPDEMLAMVEQLIIGEAKQGKRLAIFKRMCIDSSYGSNQVILPPLQTEVVLKLRRLGYVVSYDCNYVLTITW